VTQNPAPGNLPHQPSRSDRLRPAEFVGLSGGMGLFVGLTILLSTREVVLSLVGFGIVFIVTLVVIAMFALGMKRDAAEESDLDEQNHGG
jgi:hypothetical protein